MSQPTQDPFDSATNAQLPAATYYGKVQCDAWYCALVKGTGKVVYDPKQHPIEQRRTAIAISLAPIPEQTVQFPLVREMIAESREWASIVWPSAKALGVNSARELNGRWAKIEIVPTGRKYTNQQGETKDATTFKFAALYPDEATCRAAYHGAAAGTTEAEPTPVVAENGKEREAALAFLKVLVPQWCSKGLDPAAVTAGITANPVIARHFTVDSPEVVNLMMACAK